MHMGSHLCPRRGAGVSCGQVPKWGRGLCHLRVPGVVRSLLDSGAHAPWVPASEGLGWGHYGPEQWLPQPEARHPLPQSRESGRAQAQDRQAGALLAGWGEWALRTGVPGGHMDPESWHTHQL